MLHRSCALILLLAASCASATSEQLEDFSLVTSPLRIDLEDFCDAFAIRVERAADEIAASSSSSEVKRNAVYWKMRSIPAVRNCLALADDEAAYLDIWMYCARMGDYLEVTGGEVFFGESGPIAVEAVEELEIAIRKRGGQFLDEEQFAVARQWIDENKIDQLEKVALRAYPDESGWTTIKSNVLHKPIDTITRPLQNLTGGLSDTAIAVHRVASSMENMGVQADHMPENVRWQIDLLLLELEQNRLVLSALESLARVGASSESLSATAASLPEELRDQLAKFLTELEGSGAQETVQQALTTLEGLDGKLGQVETIVATTDQTAQSVASMSAALTETLQAFSTVMDGFESDPGETTPEVEPQEKGPPFDINDYGRTAGRLTETAQALTELLSRAQDQEKATAIMATAQSTVRGTANLILWRLTLFAFTVFALAFAYRYLGRLVFDKPRAQS